MQTDERSDRFPDAVYARNVLEINFRDAQESLLQPLIDIHYAHVLMLARQEIIPIAVAQRCLSGLAALDLPAIRSAAYDGRSEDLFFYVENALEMACGAENAGRMHTARSRNDIDITLYRMRMRSHILEILSDLAALRQTMLTLAAQHVGTLMPAYTHTQPAQPITLAHYLLAVIELLSRDAQRFQAAYGTVNRCPMGACAISTTGFPIDRQFTSELLGFEGLQLNSYGAIAATDYVTETAGAIGTSMVNLGRVTQDLLQWCTAEFGYLRLSDAWVQISSIMPQKRNPVPLEHCRVLASKSLAQASGIFTALHNTPFGDINDAEDDLQPLVNGAVSDARRVLQLMKGVLNACEIDKVRMAERAHADFLTVTELADTLVRSEGISFRESHRLVSASVKDLRGVYSDRRMVESVVSLAPRHLGRELVTPVAELLQSLDPWNFVNVRAIPGGPSPVAVEAALEAADQDANAAGEWLNAARSRMSAYPERLRLASLEVHKALQPTC